MKAIRAPARGIPVGDWDGDEGEEEAVEIGGGLDGPPFVAGRSLRSSPAPAATTTTATAIVNRRPASAGPLAGRPIARGDRQPPVTSQPGR
jgi:hypothetical protein